MTYRPSNARRIRKPRVSKRSSFRPQKPSLFTSAARFSLMLGTALGCSIAIGMTAAPGKALAADECGAETGNGLAICTAAGNPYPTGIDYTASAGEDISVVLTGTPPIAAVHVVAVANDGVTAVNPNVGFDAYIYAEAGATVSADYDGVYASAAAGNADIISVELSEIDGRR